MAMGSRIQKVRYSLSCPKCSSVSMVFDRNSGGFASVVCHAAFRCLPQRGGFLGVNVFLGNRVIERLHQKRIFPRADFREPGSVRAGAIARAGGVGRRDEAERDHRPCNRRDDPGPAGTQQLVKHRYLQPVDNRGPQKLEGIGERDPVEEADGGAINPHIAQPVAQLLEHHVERQARRETQNQHGKHDRREIDFRRVEPATLLGYLCIRHASVSVLSGDEP